MSRGSLGKHRARADKKMHTLHLRSASGSFRGIYSGAAAARASSSHRPLSGWAFRDCHCLFIATGWKSRVWLRDTLVTQSEQHPSCLEKLPGLAPRGSTHVPLYGLLLFVTPTASIFGGKISPSGVASQVRRRAKVSLTGMSIEAGFAQARSPDH